MKRRLEDITDDELEALAQKAGKEAMERTLRAGAPISYTEAGQNVIEYPSGYRFTYHYGSEGRLVLDQELPPRKAQ